MLKELREKVLETAIKLRKYGLVVVAGGTVCARDKKTGLIAITPSGMDYDDMSWEDVCIIDLELNIIAGKRKISVASEMFIEIMKARKDVYAVIHTHSRYATSFACIGEEIPVVTTTQANLCGGSVPVVKPIYPGVYTMKHIDNVINTLGNRMACNLMNHGPVCVGKTLEECLEVAVTIEVTAQNTFLAKSMGRPYILNNEEIEVAYSYCKTTVGQN